MATEEKAGQGLRVVDLPPTPHREELERLATNIDILKIRPSVEEVLLGQGDITLHAMVAVPCRPSRSNWGEKKIVLKG